MDDERHGRTCQAKDGAGPGKDGAKPELRPRQNVPCLTKSEGVVRSLDHPRRNSICSFWSMVVLFESWLIVQFICGAKNKALISDAPFDRQLALFTSFAFALFFSGSVQVGVEFKLPTISPGLCNGPGNSICDRAVQKWKKSVGTTRGMML